jgi:NTP pyrophosphatase (non-canonical NTP hydrolase)
LSYTKRGKKIYIAHITKDYKLYRKSFNNYMDALIWRAKKEVELFGQDTLQADKLIALVVAWGREHKISNPDKQLLKVIEEVSEMVREVVRGRYNSAEIADGIGDSLITIIILSDILGYDPVKMLNDSYDVVAKRTGKTVDGSFIKDSDG